MPKSETPQSATIEQVLQKLEELEDMQLLEQLNSLEMREELQNIHKELDGLGIEGAKPGERTAPSGAAPGSLDEVYAKMAELEQKVSEAGLRTPEELKDKISEVEEKLKSLEKIPVAEGGQIDYNAINSYIDQKVQEMSKSIPREKGGFLRRSEKAPEVDMEKLKGHLVEEVQRLWDVNMNLMRQQVSNEVSRQMESKSPGDTIIQYTGDKKVIEKRLKQLKEDIIDSIPHLDVKLLDKKVSQVSRVLDKMDERLGASEMQISTILKSIPREMKSLQEHTEERFETTDRILESIREDLKKAREFMIEKASAPGIEEAQRMMEDKVVEVKNEIMARDLSEANLDSRLRDFDKKLAEVDNKMKTLKFEITGDIAKLRDLEKFKNDLRNFEEYLNTQIREKLSILKPEMIDQMLKTMNELRTRMDKIETGAPQGMIRAIEDLRAKEDTDRRDIEKILLVMKSELDRIHMASRDIHETVLEKIDEFEKTIPEAELTELNKLRGKIGELEVQVKSLSSQMKSRFLSRPTVIE